MFDTQITLFNFHKATGAWYTTSFTGVDLEAVHAVGKATQRGEVNSDTVTAIINVAVGQNGNITAAGVIKEYVKPKMFATSGTPNSFFTFCPETDFFIVGNHCLSEPVADDDYESGLYHAMNDEHDDVYMISSAAYFSLIPHFEIGGR